MTIEELKVAKRNMDEGILKLIQEFESSAKMTVGAVNLVHAKCISNDIATTIQCTTEVGL